MLTTTIVAVAGLCALTAASPAGSQLEARSVSSDSYAPHPATCPIPVFQPRILRAANGISSQEAAYVKARKQKADVALAAWLKNLGDFSTSSQPTVAFASSGGGLRSLLTTAGVVQAFDGRDSDAGVAGLYQAFTYEAGLSGGAWFLSSLAGNNWPTVSSLQSSLWSTGLNNSGLDPVKLLSDGARYSAIIDDMKAKQDAGFDTTLIDPYGRLLSYALLSGPDGGVGTRLSTLTALSNWTSHDAPFPIITARGVDDSYTGGCNPVQNSTEYEFNPYEYGSWDAGISAFAQTKYMGSKLINGRPQYLSNPQSWAGLPSVQACSTGYDNIGYILGTSSDLFNLLCNTVQPANSTSAGIWADLSGMVNETHAPVFQDIFAIYNNPFFKSPQSPKVADRSILTMTDGGQAGQNIPIWPFIQPSEGARAIDVLIATDSSSDTDDNFPTGISLYNTFITAGNTSSALAKRMPYIPPVSTLIANKLNKKATFFGCNATSPDALFIVYLPNVAYSFPSNESTFKVTYAPNESASMIANGVQVGTQDGDEDWPTCLACAIKSKDKTLPNACNACFQKYCYYKEGTSGG